MKHESITQMYSKDIAPKPFFVCTERMYVRRDRHTDKGDAICPPPTLKMAGA